MCPLFGGSTVHKNIHNMLGSNIDNLRHFTLYSPITTNTREKAWGKQTQNPYGKQKPLHCLSPNPHSQNYCNEHSTHRTYLPRDLAGQSTFPPAPPTPGS